ncbi:cytochrome P450 monooxygenase pc-bph [Multifurca ochricompacta]|uniref:Cytochrome P450 monooxygenase pc-bph n=1 Tax=Multifurca ochricompacta TaxID=376703 RepID=A0AAD4M5V0_9AGAM|nr:cytochrome P450 monooxygenase pc-bph [Multifurca ochricompacta]
MNLPLENTLFQSLPIPWLLDPHGLRSFPGPFLARFSDLWLGRVAQQGHRSEIVHALHEKYGTFVRIAPNHLSISDPAALQIIYAHGNGSLKANFYDAFVSIARGLFNTRSRAEHSRKRKIIAHIFSQKSVLEFEPYVKTYVQSFMEQWDRLCVAGAKGLQGNDGEGGWRGRDGRVWLDCLPWYNYLAFDIIGDLAFGSPFGMIAAAKDSAPVAKSQEQAISMYGQGDSKCDTVSIPAIKILNERGEYSAATGVLPLWLRPVVKRYIPWYSRGSEAVEHLAGLAIAAVAKRLSSPAYRVDVLSKLQDGKDDNGNPMGREELTAEALTQLIAGSDTTSNSSCAITYYLASNPNVQKKLQKELDDALANEDDPVSSYEVVKNLPYLEAVINEALRLHSTSGIGLPRIVPQGGLTIQGHFFEEGTTLSVPSYTIHRDREVWGDDALVFRPERWFERDNQAIQKTFNPFSYGPRACVGRNLATLELLVIISSIFRRYEVVLEHPDRPLETREGFLRKPLSAGLG